jgi:hypothetical protein
MGKGGFGMGNNSMLATTPRRKSQNDEGIEGRGVSSGPASNSRTGAKRKQAGRGSTEGGWKSPPHISATTAWTRIGCLARVPASGHPPILAPSRPFSASGRRLSQALPRIGMQASVGVLIRPHVSLLYSHVAVATSSPQLQPPPPLLSAFKISCSFQQS